MRPGAAVRSVATDSSDPYRSLREKKATIGWTSSLDGQTQDLCIFCVGKLYGRWVNSKTEGLRYKHRDWRMVEIQTPGLEDGW